MGLWRRLLDPRPWFCHSYNGCKWGKPPRGLLLHCSPPFARGMMCSISKRIMTKCCRLRQYPQRFLAAARTRRSITAEMEARPIRSREHGSQATSYRDLPGLGFAHQSAPIHLHQHIQPSAVNVVKLALAIAGEQAA